MVVPRGHPRIVVQNDADLPHGYSGTSVQADADFPCGRVRIFRADSGRKWRKPEGKLRVQQPAEGSRNTSQGSFKLSL